MVRDRAQVLSNLESAREQLVDARSQGRFEGSDPEPRPGLRGGHIPASRNLPFTDLLDRETQTLLPAEQLSERFAAAGIDMKRPVITTCGSGLTAAVLALGLHIAGHKDVSLYDGSWAEWGDPDSEMPVATGPAD
jgi:thiosulfate/3-mercaptopyruvate sulfurtransferase